MSLKPEDGDLAEKHTNAVPTYEPGSSGNASSDPENLVVASGTNKLHQDLKGRHMQMIAMQVPCSESSGGAIGAGLFVNSASAFQSGGPGSVLLGFMIIGGMIYLVMQALAEMAVMYPVNGAFTMYICRFVDPSWGFACGWQYAISWLTVLPFEISAACNIIHFWPGSAGINNSAWIVPLLVALVAIQFFGVEFVLSIIKITACLGFMILGIIIDCGGVPTDPRGYIGAQYWHAPHTAFLNGFHGFCTVFVTASFAYTGTELTGLAAAETANPKKEIPRASKQVVWRLAIFYIINLFLVGLIVPADSPLYKTEGSTSRHSPFVIAIQLARIKALPSIFNAVILISVMSVANSCTFGSTRTIQALAANVDELPFKAAFGIWGSYLCLLINVLALMAQFYVALYPVGDKALSPTIFFEDYLAGPFLLALYVMWKVYSWFVRPEDRPLYVKIKDIDIYSGMRETQVAISGADVPEEQRRASIAELHGEKKTGVKARVMGVIRNVF
ncbi:hypothetical protein ACEPPN_019037 [Leptodophora sp. 'Broadleaf-Isolate-01']